MVTLTNKMFTSFHDELQCSLSTQFSARLMFTKKMSILSFISTFITIFFFFSFFTPEFVASFVNCYFARNSNGT